MTFIVASEAVMLDLSSGPISMSEGIGIARFLPDMAELMVRQSECAWCNQQDRSQAEAETEVKTKRSDRSTAKDVVTLRIARFYASLRFSP